MIGKLQPAICSHFIGSSLSLGLGHKGLDALAEHFRQFVDCQPYKNRQLIWFELVSVSKRFRYNRRQRNKTPFNSHLFHQIRNVWLFIPTLKTKNIINTCTRRSSKALNPHPVFVQHVDLETGEVPLYVKIDSCHILGPVIGQDDIKPVLSLTFIWAKTIDVLSIL